MTAPRGILRRMLSVEHKMGLQAFWMKFLLLPDQDTRVTRLAYTHFMPCSRVSYCSSWQTSLMSTPTAFSENKHNLRRLQRLELDVRHHVCLHLGFAVVATTGPAGVVLLLQPLGQEFVQIVIGIVSGLFVCT